MPTPQEEAAVMLAQWAREAEERAVERARAGQLGELFVTPEHS
jgi:hypothetical protein